jgi:hypothetical protein
LALLLVLVALVAGGCRVVHGIVDTQRALRRAGFDHVGIKVEHGDLDVVRIEARETRAHDRPNDAIAEVVWREFPFRFDRVDVDVARTPSRSYDRTELRELFGTRRASLDDESLEHSLRRTGVIVLVVIGVAFVGFAAVVITTIVLVVRAQHRRRQGPQPGY